METSYQLYHISSHNPNRISTAFTESSGGFQNSKCQIKITYLRWSLVISDFTTVRMNDPPFVFVLLWVKITIIFKTPSPSTTTSQPTNNKLSLSKKSERNKSFTNPPENKALNCPSSPGSHLHPFKNLPCYHPITQSRTRQKSHRQNIQLPSILRTRRCFKSMQLFSFMLSFSMDRQRVLWSTWNRQVHFRVTRKGDKTVPTLTYKTPEINLFWEEHQTLSREVIASVCRIKIKAGSGNPATGGML